MKRINNLGVLIILMLSISLLFLSSCSGSKRGLTIEVLKAPRTMVYTGENDVYPINVLVKNNGESMAGGSLYIYGFSPDLIWVEGVVIPKVQRNQNRISISMDNDHVRLDFSGLTNLKLGNLSIIGLPELVINNNKIGSGGSFLISYKGLTLNLRGLISGNEKYFELGPLRIEKNNKDVNLFLGDYPIDLKDKENLIEAISYGGIFVPTETTLMSLFSRNGFTFLMNGNNRYSPGEKRLLKTFNVHLNDLPLQMSEVKQRIGIRACYAYTTDAIVDECIDPTANIDINDRTKPCRFTESPTIRNTAGPVYVSRIEQQVANKKLFLTIHIKKQGNGVVWNPFSLYKCSPYYNDRIEFNDQNVVYIGSIFMSNEFAPLDCKPSRKVVLNEHGEGIVNCIYPLRHEATYFDQLFIELWYGYQEDIFIPVTIKNLS